MATRRGRSGVRAPATPEPVPPVPWRVRFSPRLLSEDYHEIGHAAFEAARTAINKKLTVDPEGYGATLRSPLQGLYKLKASHLRVVYHLEVARHEVWALMMGGRRDIWEDEQGEILDRRLSAERTMRRTRDEEAAKPPAKKQSRRR